jgi:hypothetical protein
VLQYGEQDPFGNRKVPPDSALFSRRNAAPIEVTDSDRDADDNRSIMFLGRSISFDPKAVISHMKSLFFALLAIASFSADSFGQTVIYSVPYTISTPGTYIVGSNLVYPSATGAAISIVISQVTLDLAGN